MAALKSTCKSEYKLLSKKVSTLDCLVTIKAKCSQIVGHFPFFWVYQFNYNYEDN